MRIPTMASGGLNYGAQLLRPARGIQVRAVAAGTQTVLATATTDGTATTRCRSLPTPTSASSWSLRCCAIPASRCRAGISARGMLKKALSPTPCPTRTPMACTFNSNAGTARNVDIPSGFNASGAVTGTRLRRRSPCSTRSTRACSWCSASAPTTNFPELVLDWATNNPGGETYFDSPASNPQLIVLSADVDRRHGRVRPARHRARVRPLHRVQLLARRQHRRRARSWRQARRPRGLRRRLRLRLRAIVLNDPVARRHLRVQWQQGLEHLRCRRQSACAGAIDTSAAGAASPRCGRSSGISTTTTPMPTTT